MDLRFRVTNSAFFDQVVMDPVVDQRTRPFSSDPEMPLPIHRFSSQELFLAKRFESREICEWNTEGFSSDINWIINGFSRINKIDIGCFQRSC